MNKPNDLDTEIRALYDTRPDPGLRRRLSRIPHERNRTYRPRVTPWFIALPAAVAAGLIGLILLQSNDTPSQPDPVAVAAVRDFVTAMTYLQKTTVYANREMQDQLGNELANVVALTRASVTELNSELKNGG
jgi:hypothetical protein